MKRRRHHRLLILTAPMLPLLAGASEHCFGQMIFDTENFNVDPNWDGHNNRSTFFGPATVTESFGYSSNRVGGTINPTGEVSYFAQSVSNSNLNSTLSASGTLNNNGGGNSWIGFFNSATSNEWRTANSLGLRIYGRGGYFLAYPEYGTSKWRAGADGFVSGGNEVQFPVNTNLNWSLSYNPAGNGGGGTITAVINGQTVVKNLDAGHKADTATFNRFGLGAVNKSWDSPGQLFIDNVSVNGGITQTFTGGALGWSGVNNNATYSTNNVRFRFDFGYSNTHNAGGAGTGEAGGNFFRGDSRQAETMAFYGAPLDQLLTLNQPLQASGKISFHRGVSDSTVHLGFFHNTDSVRVSQQQATSTPEDFLGVTVEGPSSEGFYFYPSYSSDGEGQGSGGNRGLGTQPYIYPNGATHNWTLNYDPNGNGGTGQIVVTLDGQQAVMNLDAAHRNIGGHFNRFGFITPHIDGNGQTVFIDDITYTTGFGAGAQWAINDSGDWQTASNWIGSGVPNGVGASATFGNNNIAGRTVFITAPTKVGTLNFNSLQSWEIAGLSTLTLEVASGFAQVNVTQGVHKINVPLMLASSTQVNVAAGAQLKISDPVTIASGKTLTHTGPGAVTYESTVTLASGASLAFVSDAEVGGLSMASDSTVDVGDALVVRGSNYDTIRSKVRQGRHGGDWRGDGITSARAAGDVFGSSALGLLDGGDAVLVKYTYYGDTDLSGSVEMNDLESFFAGYDGLAATPKWSDGDFDLSGVVDRADFERLFDGLCGQRWISPQAYDALEHFVAAEGISVNLTAIPEPASIAVLWVTAASATLVRRRRR